MTITAKYAATCPTCHGRITVGDSIEWSKGSPARHTACGGAKASAPVVGAASARRASRPGKWTGCSCGSREDSDGQLIPARNNCQSCRFDSE